jgi:hypothetical protein
MRNPAGAAPLDLEYRAGGLAPTPAAIARAANDLPPPSPAQALEKTVAKSVRPDCKETYASLGLLAAPRLVWDLAKQEGSKW